MASFANIYKFEPRPCIVDIPKLRRGSKVECAQKKALFHLWSHESTVVEPSLLKGGHPGGTVATTMAIVEFEDGQVETVPASYIRFFDEKIKDYAFPEKGVDTADDIEDGEIHDA